MTDDQRPHCDNCELPDEICACEEARSYDRATCDHEWVKLPYKLGMIVFYECRKCGEEYEKDVS